MCVCRILSAWFRPLVALLSLFLYEACFSFCLFACVSSPPVSSSSCCVLLHRLRLLIVCYSCSYVFLRCLPLLFVFVSSSSSSYGFPCVCVFLYFCSVVVLRHVSHLPLLRLRLLLLLLRLRLRVVPCLFRLPCVCVCRGFLLCILIVILRVSALSSCVLARILVRCVFFVFLCCRRPLMCCVLMLFRVCSLR